MNDIMKDIMNEKGHYLALRIALLKIHLFEPTCG